MVSLSLKICADIKEAQIDWLLDARPRTPDRSIADAIVAYLEDNGMYSLTTEKCHPWIARLFPASLSSMVGTLTIFNLVAVMQSARPTVSEDYHISSDDMNRLPPASKEGFNHAENRVLLLSIQVQRTSINYLSNSTKINLLAWSLSERH